MAPVDSGIVVSHSGTTYGGGRGVRYVNGERRDKRREETGRARADTPRGGLALHGRGEEGDIEERASERASRARFPAT